MRHLSPKVVLVVAAVAIVGMRAAAQAPAQKPSFEVASIKPNKATSGPSYVFRSPDGSFRAINTTLRLLMLQAYRVFDYQLVGRLDWIDSFRFDVEAKPRPDTDKPDVLAMLQSLLEDRFQLRVHREMRNLPVFMLTVAKGGHKIQKTGVNALQARAAHLWAVQQQM